MTFPYLLMPAEHMACNSGLWFAESVPLVGSHVIQFSTTYTSLFLLHPHAETNLYLTFSHGVSSFLCQGTSNVL